MCDHDYDGNSERVLSEKREDGNRTTTTAPRWRIEEEGAVRVRGSGVVFFLTFSFSYSVTYCYCYISYINIRDKSFCVVFTSILSAIYIYSSAGGAHAVFDRTHRQL